MIHKNLAINPCSFVNICTSLRPGLCHWEGHQSHSIRNPRPAEGSRKSSGNVQLDRHCISNGTRILWSFQDRARSIDREIPKVSRMYHIIFHASFFGFFAWVSCILAESIASFSWTDTTGQEAFLGKWCVSLWCVSIYLWASWIGGYHESKLIMHPISTMTLIFK
jgi:hypothetical protein